MITGPTVDFPLYPYLPNVPSGYGELFLHVKAEGIEEATAELGRLGSRIASEDVWQEAIRGMLHQTKDYARSISPVWTGSYRSSHTIAVSGRTGVMFIHPHVINPVTIEPVTRYAGPVEERHKVYRGAYHRAQRLAVGTLEEIVGHQ